MGKNKFRLSDMIPNAWFYKLKDVGMMRGNNSTVRKKPPPPSSPKRHHYPRKSYYFTRDLIPTGDRDHTNPDPPPPTKSSKQRVAVNRRTTTSSVSAGCSCRASFWTNSDSPPRDFSASPSDTSSQELFCSDSSPPAFRSDRILAITNDVIVMNVDNKSLQLTETSHLHLPPIITKPPSKCSKKGVDEEEEEGIIKKINVIKSPTTKNIRRRRRRISAKKEETEEAAAGAYGSLSEKHSIVSTIQEQSKNRITTSSVRRNNINSVTSPRGIRLRLNSPRIVGSRKSIGRSSVSSNCSSSSLSRNNRRGGRRSLSDSLAIVKSSFDPQKDFRESMVEMIVENDIKCSEELEHLLACYLSLNADEYHDLIIMVFKQLWFDLTHITRPTTTTDNFFHQL